MVSIANVNQRGVGGKKEAIFGQRNLLMTSKYRTKNPTP